MAGTMVPTRSFVDECDFPVAVEAENYAVCTLYKSAVVLLAFPEFLFHLLETCDIVADGQDLGEVSLIIP